MISVVIPALNEARNIGYVVRLAATSPGVDEVIVIDDGSIDDTRRIAARAGARVETSTFLGKGASMEDGVHFAHGDILVYLDGDLKGLDRHIMDRLVAPIVSGKADFVKAKFSRNAGRVTTLTAKPLLATFFPELAHFSQPLGGIIAAKRELLERLSFETDYGVDLALLIDAHFAGARIVEVDIGHLEHESQSLDALGDMAKQVVRSLMHRASKFGRLSLQQVEEVEEHDREVGADFEMVLKRVGDAGKLALFDMDGTLLRDRSVLTIAERTGRLSLVERYLDNPLYLPEERTRKIAECLADIPRSTFIDAARTMPLSEGAADTIIALRKQGYRVGIVSDSYRVLTEVVRRRVFADFSVANHMRFRDGKATGEVAPCPTFRHPDGCGDHTVCKWNVVLHLERELGIPAHRVLAVGDGSNDICLLQRSAVGIAFEPKAAGLHHAADFVIRRDLRQVLDCCSEQQLAAAFA